ncbi:alanine--tRNA ligase, mitochondrial isoform X2 [Periplaneta americana]|uniref:alanine--tRNA ligase, mitochondrial isoform X2 n=1 Tax=Periplaneta americana TaxID=6978 RepID=UPI0037E77CD1
MYVMSSLQFMKMWGPALPHNLSVLHLFLRLARHCHTAGSLSGKAIRQSFIDYYVKEHDHTFLRSSPVVPFCDPTVAFVNAGMNQFKGVFLGNAKAPCARAANSQKCIRVGGKHNDLDVVGADGYHHTFFEMLGSWSFGDYFKKEACELAWNLLTDRYGLHPSRLYVTYFGGDPAMGLRPDLETRDIWRQIGVSSDRIMPFGSDDNFWEMGVSGPCGPCTEIHVDHIAGRKQAADRVNKGHDDLTEIWNLVFIQYDRNIDGSLKELPCCHVDTGMGLERLVAVLQGKRSNYDTDLFRPLFSAIHKYCRNVPVYQGRFGDQDDAGIDTGYRILADHTRMMTVALADGMFPDQNYKLRRIMRKAMLVSQQKFGVESGLVTELTNHVAESLGDVYPEIRSRLKQIQLMVNHEEELLRSLRLGATTNWQKILSVKPELAELDIVEMPGVVAGYHELASYARSSGVVKTSDKPQSQIELEQSEGKSKKAAKSENDKNLGETMLSNDLAFKLYDTYGLEENVIKDLAKMEGLQMDVNGFRNLLNMARFRTKESFSSEVENEQLLEAIAQLDNSGLATTEDSLKYSYTKQQGKYLFPRIECEVKAIIVGGKLVAKVEPGVKCSVVLDKTSFYHEAGGQASDVGHLVLENGSLFHVMEVTNCRGYLLHHGYVSTEGARVCVGDRAVTAVDAECRIGNMRNHTATHLLNAALRGVLTVTCQKSSHVTDSSLVFDFSVYGETLNSENIEQLEGLVQECVKAGVPVKRHTLRADELFSFEDVTLLPGEVYPDQDIHVIEIEAEGKLTSREACCGTHVLNTADIRDFCIVGLKTAGTGVRSLRAVTGDHAKSAHQEGRSVMARVTDLLAEVDSFLSADGSAHQAEVLDGKLHGLKQSLMNSSQALPYSVRARELQKMELTGKRLKECARGNLRSWCRRTSVLSCGCSLYCKSSAPKGLLLEVRTPALCST